MPYYALFSRLLNKKEQIVPPGISPGSRVGNRHGVLQGHLLRRSRDRGKGAAPCPGGVCGDIQRCHLVQGLFGHYPSVVWVVVRLHFAAFATQNLHYAQPATKTKNSNESTSKLNILNRTLLRRKNSEYHIIQSSKITSRFGYKQRGSSS